jgi:hypothetical protein
MYFIFYPYKIGVFLYLMIIVNSRLLHQLHSLSSTPHFFTRQRIASDTTFADFVWNDQIDDFINFCSEYLL